MVEQIAPELVERMVSCLEIVASMKPGARLEDFWEAVDEAKAIVADLPKPVDRDLIEARELAAQAYERENYSGVPAAIRAGKHDTGEGYYVPVALAAIKRGRSLARTDQETAHVR